MRFELNKVKVDANSLNGLKTNIRHKRIKASDNDIITVVYPKGTRVNYKITISGFNGVGSGKKPSGKSKKGARKATAYTNVRLTQV